MTTKEALHRLIDELPEDQAERLLRELSDPVLRSLLTAPTISELLADEQRTDLEEARAALADADTGATVPWERIKADLGL
jgi:hypothetical protein